jgi:hypothetical protein
MERYCAATVLPVTLLLGRRDEGGCGLGGLAMRFTVREIAMAIVVAAIGLVWWVDHRNQVAKFWDLRSAIQDADLSVYVEGGHYHIKPMNEWERYNRDYKRKHER